MFRIRSLFFLVLTSLWLLSGCQDEAPTTYRIPKEKRAEPLPELPAGHPPLGMNKMRPLPGMEEEAAAAPTVRFVLPEGWKDVGATTMRKANLRTNDENGNAEITALVFPGDVGGTLANVNRWRNQVGLEAVTSEALFESTEVRKIAGNDGLYVNLESRPRSLLGAILPSEDRTWFFKMIGDSETVRANETAMKRFLDSIVIEEQANE